MAARCGPPFFAVVFCTERVLYRRVWGYYIRRNGQSFFFQKVVPCEGDMAIRDSANGYAKYGEGRKGLNCSIKKSYFCFEKIMDNFYEKKPLT